MLKYVLKRVLLMVCVFLIIISMCFVLVKLLPDKPPQAQPDSDSYNIIMMRREALGYNKPLIEQYWIFMTKTLLGGNWGLSEQMYPNHEVWDVFLEKLPSTMLVNIYTMLFAVPIGLLLGIYAALKKNKSDILAIL